jgi:hypothetical protein
MGALSDKFVQAIISVVGFTGKDSLNLKFASL